ncbi:unnamed protein product [Ectocarpus sp. CCAP 1310/34]|nr:unnamed protein product [Ectocarpus sp. CCAP 1310/34]
MGPHQWKGEVPSAPRCPSTGKRGIPTQYNSLPNIIEASPTPSQGPAVDTPPEKRRRGERNASSQGERGRPQEQVVTVDTPVKAARLSPGRKAQKNGLVGETEERMSAADLAAKKVLLPFINELTFIEIALAAASAAGPPDTSGTTPRSRVGPAFCESPLGKRGRGCSDDDGSSIASNNQESAMAGGGGKHQHGEVRGPSQQPPMVTSSVLNSSCKAQLPRIPGATSPVSLNGGNHGGGVSVASFEKSGGLRCSLGNPDVARVLRKWVIISRTPVRNGEVLPRGFEKGSQISGSLFVLRQGKWYPQFCDFVGLTLKAVRLEGLAPRYHPPAWTLGLCEAVLDECWKCDAQTGAGGARALRNTRRAAAGLEARLAACTTEVDKWCLAQAKDLEIRAEGERDDNCEERKKRRQRRRRQNLHHDTPTDGGGITMPGEASLEAASSLRLPEFVATFLSERFGVKAVTLQAAVDLLFGLETLRPSFPELEHFSLLLRELHDMGALALALHAREVVSRLGGLRLRDVKRRLAQPNSRHPLRNEVVVSPHPALPMAAAQVWLTRKGGIALAFLLLGGGSRGVPRSKIAGIVKDARHVVSSTRAAWGRSPQDETQQQEIPSASSKRTWMEQTGSTTQSGKNVENNHPAESTTDQGHTAESGSCMDLKLRNTAHGSTGAPCIPLYGLLFFLCELHMKTPEEIMEKSKAADNGGGLGMLATLARAAEQEDRREELSMQLAEETRTLDVLGAEVLRLEGRTRALEEAAAAAAAAAGYEGEAQGGASVIDGLSQVRVVLALKSAAARRQRDTVKTMTSEVRLADVQVAASWHDVMSPLSPPSDGEAVISTEAPIFSGGSTVSSASTTATGVAGRIATSTNAPGGGIRRPNDKGEDSSAAAKAGETMRFQIEAGDGLSKADAADLTCILRKARDVEDGKGATSIVSFGMKVPGSTPLDVKPGLAARKVLRTLRMYVTRLRVTSDNEAKAEELAATIIIQRWARRVRHDTTMIFLAKQKVLMLQERTARCLTPKL